MIPAGAIPDHLTRVLGALIDVHAETGRATVRDVADRADRAISTTHQHLATLAAMGLVAGVDSGRQSTGALRPLVVVMASG